MKTTGLEQGLLWVGDPHVQKSNLDESARLLDWTLSLAVDSGIGHVMFAGDLYNDFGVKRVEVDEFWHQKLAAFVDKGIKVYLITGNHDMNSDASSSALTVLAKEGQILVIDKPMVLSAAVGAIPFIRDNQAFLAAANALYGLGCRTLYCHQEFNGCQYENGFYAPHGADIAGLPSDLKVVSGHIHKKQRLGNVFYPGTPRHLTRSDVGEIKGVYVFTDGQESFVETPESVASRFNEILVSESGITLNGVACDSKTTLKEVLAAADARSYVDVRGSKEFVSKTVKKIPDQVKVRTFLESEAKPSGISESDGMPKAFIRFASQYIKEKKLDQEQSMKVLSKIYDRCPMLKEGL